MRRQYYVEIRQYFNLDLFQMTIGVGPCFVEKRTDTSNSRHDRSLSDTGRVATIYAPTGPDRCPEVQAWMDVDQLPLPRHALEAK
jgi:hypothetical protein